jgi:hypothetical protein
MMWRWRSPAAPAGEAPDTKQSGATIDSIKLLTASNSDLPIDCGAGEKLLTLAELLVGRIDSPAARRRD